MEKNSYHVIAKSNGKWSVVKAGAERASGNFPTKSEAVKGAAGLLKKSGGGELIVHKTDGRVSSRNSYGNGADLPENAGTNGNGSGTLSRAGAAKK